MNRTESAMQTTLRCSILAVLTLLSSAVFASDRGSMEDQIACTPDVYRLCSQLIPDEDAITACLQKNLPNLSNACHKVFTNVPGTPTPDE